ncbi:DUF7344 domain-containing protein [Haloarcula litorea]|uniref:DUF7344 domain-containing protein n=1 Tax=Haloarcula litorea TaxID=3032579 RepID=UPI0023E79D2E|nr:hypothetical protein [Halomicroarcula sp. GDY20]
MPELDAVYRALAAEERRLALVELQRHRTITLADLAELVAEAETGADIADIPEERVTDTYFSLYHSHVPTLEECGLVSYDQDDDLVSAADDCGEVLDRVRENLERLQQRTAVED